MGVSQQRTAKFVGGDAALAALKLQKKQLVTAVLPRAKMCLGCNKTTT